MLMNNIFFLSFSKIKCIRITLITFSIMIANLRWYSRCNHRTETEQEAPFHCAFNDTKLSMWWPLKKCIYWKVKTVGGSTLRLKMKKKRTHENDIIALLENSFSPIVEINSVVIKHVFIQIIWSIKEASTLSKAAWIYGMILNNLAIYQIFFLKCCTT